MTSATFCLPLWIFLLECLVVLAHREEECVEVGFARASYITVEGGYQSAKNELLEKWPIEDKEGKPSYKHLSQSLKNVTRTALLLENASKNILATIRKTRVGKRCPEEWLLKGVEKHVTPLIQLDKEFAEDMGLVMSFRCLVGSPYPNVDGTCNHEDAPDLGSIGSKFLRLLPPVTGKGGFSLRSSVDKDKTLPSARSVAQLIRRHVKKPSVTALFSEYGHFVARDSFSIPESPQAEGANCCKTPDHDDCAPIYVEEGDPLHSTTDCINYRRSIPAQAILGHRESFSDVSTFFDATPIYGATNEEAFEKKTGYFGYLKSPETEESPNKKLTKCGFPDNFKDCFINTESESIEGLDLLFILEHNFIVDSLAEINPHFDDSLLYNEARRINIALYNNILYGEYLPILLGEETTEKHALRPGTEGLAASFIPEVNPGILTSFALAASWNPSMITEWKSDWGKTNIVNSHQYESIWKDSFQDLLSMDIQRGRDHGLPSLEAWNGFCDTGNKASSWEELETIFSKDAVEDLKKLYKDEIKDIDLASALLEHPKEGAIIGKIFVCVLADQFARLKTGNRFYWEHPSSMISEEQKASIRETKATTLLCRHFALEKVPSNPFLPVSDSNPEVSCKDQKSLDFTFWKDTSLIEAMKKKQEDEKQIEKEQDERIQEKEKEEEEEEEKKKTKETPKEKKKRVIRTGPDDELIPDESFLEEISSQRDEL